MFDAFTFFIVGTICAGSAIVTSKNETINAREITRGITKINFPMIPGIKNIGAKAIRVVRIVVNTGPNTSETPLMAAFNGESPISRRRKIFSEIIMLSSTIIPITIIKAANEIISMCGTKRGSSQNTA